MMGGQAALDSFRAGAFGQPTLGWKARALAARAAAEAAAEEAPERAVATAVAAAVEEGARTGRTRWAVEALGVPVREGLLRDVFGDPFHLVAIGPAWRTPTVLALAQAAYGLPARP